MESDDWMTDEQKALLKQGVGIEVPPQHTQPLEPCAFPGQIRKKYLNKAGDKIAVHLIPRLSGQLIKR